MQFSRTIFNNASSTQSDATRDISGVQVSNNFTNLVKSCGFVNLDGSEIDGTQAVSQFKWKYDTENIKNKSYWSLGVTGYNGFLSTYRYHSGTTAVSIGDCYVGTVSGDAIARRWCHFFVPLKNNGFYSVMYCPYGYYNDIPLTPTIFSYSKTIPVTHSNYHNYGGALGFFNNVTNEWNYFWKSASYSAAQGIYYDNREYSLTNTIDSLTDATGDKTDVKEGICTLIKPPYQNEFLNNIYIVSTAPCAGTNDANGTDNKFFSFNGRNFYGFWRNLVVELPAN